MGRSAANEKTAASGVRADEITVRKSSGCGVVLFDRATLKRGHFERERAGIVEKLPKLAGAALSLLKCLRTPKYTRLQDFAITISQDFSGDDTPDPRKSAPDAWIQAFPLFLFTKRPLLKKTLFRKAGEDGCLKTRCKISRVCTLEPP